MKLLTAEIIERAPALGSTQSIPNIAVPIIAKFFDTRSNWTWYMTEYSPEERLAFGVVDGHERELGYFYIDELEAIGPRIERDLYFGTHMLAEVLNGARP